MKETYDARFTSEKAEKMIGNKFDMVLIATRRARELSRGDASLVPKNNDKPAVIAIREIEEGKIGIEYLKKVG
jgi:DNA-directed RNA polymerase subunit omega